jgi:hypothetical protein
MQLLQLYNRSDFRGSPLDSEGRAIDFPMRPAFFFPWVWEANYFFFPKTVETNFFFPTRASDQLLFSWRGWGQVRGGIMHIGH